MSLDRQCDHPSEKNCESSQSKITDATKLSSSRHNMVPDAPTHIISLSQKDLESLHSFQRPRRSNYGMDLTYQSHIRLPK